MAMANPEIRGERQFPTTSWSLIRGAQSASPEDYARHMTRLAETYWRPVYWFIRYVWHKSHDDAKDLTQEFFATVVFERKLVDGYARTGSGFRSFLRAAISRFMVDERRGAERIKRGGGLTIASLEALGAASFEGLRDETNPTPEQIFDRAWRQAVVTEAVALLEERLIAEGKGAEFAVFKRYDYEGGFAEMSYDQLAEAMSMTERQVRHALSSVRKLFRAAVTGIVGGYVEDPAELDAELRSLFGV